MREEAELRTHLAVFYAIKATPPRMHNTPKESHGSQVITPTVAKQRQIEETLRENNARLRHLIEHAADAFILHDPDGKILDVNPRACYSLGYTRDELLRLRVGDIEGNFDPGKLEQIWAHMQRGAPVTLEGMHQRKDGSWFPVEVRVGLIEAGPRPIILALVRDITERKQAEAEIHKLNQELEDRVRERTAELEKKNEQLAKEITERRQAEETAQAANQAKSAFLANMSHELRTPLNAVIGYAQLMQHDDAVTTTQQQNLQTIQDSGQHLLNLINDVLEMAKIETGHIGLEWSSFDLRQLLESLGNMFRMRAEQKGLALRVVCHDGVPQYIRSDERKLRQVLINLLSNAIKFTDEGSITLRVHGEKTLEGASSDRRLRVEVEDTGMGIGQEEVTAIFEAFGQSESGRRAREGTGLGLSISHRFVEMLGG